MLGIATLIEELTKKLYYEMPRKGLGIFYDMDGQQFVVAAKDELWKNADLQKCLEGAFFTVCEERAAQLLRAPDAGEGPASMEEWELSEYWSALFGSE